MPKKLDKTSYVQRYSGSGGLRTVCLHSVEDLILSQDNDHTRASPREVERTTGISRSSICRIAKIILVSGYSKGKECRYFNLPQIKRDISKLREFGLVTK